MALGIWILLIFLLYTRSPPNTGRSNRVSDRNLHGSNNIITGGIYDLKQLGYKARPKLLVYHFDKTGTVHRAQRLEPFPLEPRYPTKRTIEISEAEREARKQLKNSRYYQKVKRDPFITEDCVQLHDWQLTPFSTCNLLHEVDITDFGSVNDELLDWGAYRDVWIVKQFDGVKKVLKTLRYKRDFDDRSLDRHKRDAIAMDRLTSSPYVADIFGFCGASGLFEYGEGGDLNNFLWPDEKKDEPGSLDKLRVAAQIARSIADTHNIDKEGQASIVHTDISTSQFILTDGMYKLNDFNRCRFMRWNTREDRPCGFYVGANKGEFRAPEEYRYDEEDEKVDVYSMGNIFYILLTRDPVWKGIRTKDAQEKVMKGERPPISDSIRESSDPVDIALLKAMEMCHIHDPEERASAREVLNYLSAELEKINETESM